MKISKLFHWLYAILMLLPICGIFTKVGYVMFNKNAYQSYSGSYTYEGTTTLTNTDVDNLFTDLQLDLSYRYGPGRQYKNDTSNFIGTYSLYLDSNTQPYFTVGSRKCSALITNLDNITINSDDVDFIANTIVITYYDLNAFAGNKYVSFFNIDYSLYNVDTICYDGNGKPYRQLLAENLTTQQITYFDAVQIYNLYESSFILNFTKLDTSFRGLYYYDTPDYITVTNVNFLYNVKVPTIVYDNTLSSVFYSSLQELDNTEFFSWAKDSFLVQPILYIGNLFGITSPHPIFTLMSYWLAISIIWLVFDLVMYLPLLVHRWIDKGVIE